MIERRSKKVRSKKSTHSIGVPVLLFFPSSHFSAHASYALSFHVLACDGGGVGDGFDRKATVKIVGLLSHLPAN